MSKRLSFTTAALSIVAMWLSCSVPPAVNVKVHKAAGIHLPGVKKVAIADFQGPERSGSQFATLFQQILLTTEYYEIIERDRLRSVLEEQNLGQTGVVNEETAVEIGKLLGVDALIFGEVATHDIEPDERGTEKVSTKVGTGKYEWVEEKNIFTGKTKKVKKEIMKTTLVDQHYRVRRGTVAVNFRVVGVEDGRLLAARSESQSYNSGKMIEGSKETLKPEGEILRDLSMQICEKFVRLISPYYQTEKRTIEPGKGSIGVGAKYAQAGLWPEAMEAWKKAVVELPNEPAARYNLGLGYEVQGMLDEAEHEYQIASSMKQKKLYMEALARIRAAKEEQERLRKQLEERE